MMSGFEFGTNQPTAEGALALALLQAEAVIREGRIADGLYLYLDIMDDHPDNSSRRITAGNILAYNLGYETIKTPDDAMTFLLGLDWHREERERRATELDT